MKRFMQGFTRRFLAFWNAAGSHASTLVAVVLIVFALATGIHIGRAHLSPPSHADDAPETAEADGRMYTCSMHPSVRLPDPNAKCPICFMDLIPVEAGADDDGEWRLRMSQTATRLAEVRTTTVVRAYPEAEVRLFGRLDYDQSRVARIAAYFPGRLERLYADFVGAPVRPGDHLAEIYSPELLAAFEELRLARRAVDEDRTDTGFLRSTADATLRAARDRLRLLGLRPEQVERIETGETTGDTLTLYAPLAGIVTERSAIEGEYVRTGDPIVTVADLSRLWLMLEAYESQLPLVRWGQRVSFEVAALPGERFEGRVSFIDPMVDGRTRTAGVRVSVDNADGRLKPGMFATGTVRARLGAAGVFAEDDFAGKWVSPMHPEIVRDGPGACDVCGMALVPAEELGLVMPDPGEPPLVIPRTAALVTGARAVVYVRVEVEDEERAVFEGRTVTLGPRAGDLYIVRDGVREGELVVSHGAFRIDSEMQISARPSMMGEGGEMHAGHAHGAPPAAREAAEVPREFVGALTPVYAAYFEAQEALAADDFGRYLRSLPVLADATRSVEPHGMRGEPLGRWRRVAAALAVGDAPGDIESARVGFEAVALAMIEAQRLFGHAGDTAHRIAHCPMAFDFRGADWLQRTREIANPYFGAAMLRCGTIEDEFAPAADGGQGEHGHD